MDLPTIKHPEWIPGAAESIQTSLRLYAEGKLPQVLAGMMLATPAIRLLRCIYGSDFEVAAAIREKAEKSAREGIKIAACPECKGRASVGNDRPCSRCFPELAEIDFGRDRRPED